MSQGPAAARVAVPRRARARRGLRVIITNIVFGASGLVEWFEAQEEILLDMKHNL
jgi:hypothetical protein